MRELVVISGKGGTGKTSIVASLAVLARRAVLADCDVDAADLHLVLEPEILRREAFSGGKRARVDASLCVECGRCMEVCRFDAIGPDAPDGADGGYRVDPIACEGCGVCAWFCPAGAIEFAPAVNGEWFVSRTRCGPMVHARLGVAEENSGKLVSTVRAAAREQAERSGRKLIIVDGSPGVGCPVIASITGADLVLIVAEPTLSGIHDMGRIAELAKHFGVPATLCVNKWDLNAELADELDRRADDAGIAPLGRVRYDRAVTDAQLRGLSVVEHTADGPADDVRALWQRLARRIGV